jgi:hypothetical protein
LVPGINGRYLEELHLIAVINPRYLEELLLVLGINGRYLEEILLLPGINGKQRRRKIHLTKIIGNCVFSVLKQNQKMSLIKSL